MSRPKQVVISPGPEICDGVLPIYRTQLSFVCFLNFKTISFTALQEASTPFCQLKLTEKFTQSLYFFHNILSTSFKPNSEIVRLQLLPLRSRFHRGWNLLPALFSFPAVATYVTCYWFTLRNSPRRYISSSEQRNAETICLLLSAQFNHTAGNSHSWKLLYRGTITATFVTQVSFPLRGQVPRSLITKYQLRVSRLKMGYSVR